MTDHARYATTSTNAGAEIDAGDDKQPGFEFPIVDRMLELLGDIEDAIDRAGAVYGRPLVTAIVGSSVDQLRHAIRQAEVYAEVEWDRAQRATLVAEHVKKDLDQAWEALLEQQRRWHARLQPVQAIESHLHELAVNAGASGADLTASDIERHPDEQLATAAAAYAMPPWGRRALWPKTRKHRPSWWPWAAKDWHPGDRRDQLITAAGLLVREIERLDRLALQADAT